MMIPTLLHILYSVSVTAAILALGVLLGLGLWRVLKVNADREHSLRLDNLGNCTSLYQLTVTSPEPALQFTFLYNKMSLTMVSLDEEDDSEVVESSQPAPNQPARKSPSSSVVTDSGRVVASNAGKFAAFLGELGSFIPGSVGRTLKERASQAREVQANALRAGRAEQMVNRQAARVSGKTAQRGPRPGSTASHRQGADVPLAAQTPPLESGQSISLQLKIGVKKGRYPQGSFSYTIQAQPLAVDFPDVSAEPILRTGTVNFGQVGSWRYGLPVLAIILVAFVTLITLVFANIFIWM